MKKKQLKAFGREIYLIAKDTEGVLYWLEAPSFDCGWYWGFGYIESYTDNKRPDLSEDINTHQHFSSLSKGYNNICDNPYFTDFTFTKEEGKIVTDLFTEFYKLREEADAAYRKDEVTYKKLIDIELPKVMNEIINIVKP